MKLESISSVLMLVKLRFFFFLATVGSGSDARLVRDLYFRIGFLNSQNFRCRFDDSVRKARFELEPCEPRLDEAEDDFGNLGLIWLAEVSNAVISEIS
jgi:hypothetical protein